jgi:hypothetical protein
MDPKTIDAITANPELVRLANNLAQLFDGADSNAFSRAIKNDDFNALANALKLTPEQLTQIAEEIGAVSVNLQRQFPEIAEAAAELTAMQRQQAGKQ